MTPGDALLLAVAGGLAGAVNAVAGGGSLLSFPALLAVGLSPLVANVTNTVGLLPGFVGSAVAYRRELALQRSRLAPYCASIGLGSIVGCAVLLGTSEAVFEAVTPFLVLGAVLLFAGQPRLAAVLRRRSGGEHRARPVVLHATLMLAGVYATYFGAALGVVLLAVLGLLLVGTLQSANALKTALSLTTTVVGGAVFVVLAPVDFAAAGVVAATSLVGGRLGGGLARRLPDAVLRGTVIAVGLAVAVGLLL